MNRRDFLARSAGVAVLTAVSDLAPVRVLFADASGPEIWLELVDTDGHPIAGECFPVKMEPGATERFELHVDSPEQFVIASGRFRIEGPRFDVDEIDGHVRDGEWWLDRYPVPVSIGPADNVILRLDLAWSGGIDLEACAPKDSPPGASEFVGSWRPI